MTTLAVVPDQPDKPEPAGPDAYDYVAARLALALVDLIREVPNSPAYRAFATVLPARLLVDIHRQLLDEARRVPVCAWCVGEHLMAQCPILPADVVLALGEA